MQIHFDITLPFFLYSVFDSWYFKKKFTPLAYLVLEILLFESENIETAHCASLGTVAIPVAAAACARPAWYRPGRTPGPTTPSFKKVLAGKRKGGSLGGVKLRSLHADTLSRSIRSVCSLCSLLGCTSMRSVARGFFSICKTVGF